MLNIHATLVSFEDKGILIRGKSGSGKSDLALRLVMDKGAVLVADDRVDLTFKDGVLYGSSPKELFGKMEIRGLGIATFPAIEKCVISLCVDLCDNRSVVERFPQEEFASFLDISVPKITLYSFDCSTTDKIIAKICGIIT